MLDSARDIFRSPLFDNEAVSKPLYAETMPLRVLHDKCRERRIGALKISRLREWKGRRYGEATRRIVAIHLPYASRIFWITADVLRPSTSGANATRPPHDSTKSQPTTCSFA